MTLKDLAVEHDYYCHDSNYYSNDAGGEWNTWSDFYKEYNDADIDMNLIFRYDVAKVDETDKYFEIAKARINEATTAKQLQLF